MAWSMARNRVLTRPLAAFRKLFLAAALAWLALAVIVPVQANAQAYRTYTIQEIIDAGHGFFGATSGALAGAVERAFETYGLPNGYILGEEAGGAFIGGLRYGEGKLFTKNAGDHKVYWQGPSLGWDYGIEGNRTMMLVYDLPTIDFIYSRFFGVSGSAYMIGGVGVTALTRQGVNLVPIHTGLGARLGINVGYLKMSRYPELNPF
ncbi:MAG: EipA family protein [Salaquimonas sp.]|nr:EipA family protein [Salaquimonas sp.]